MSKNKSLTPNDLGDSTMLIEDCVQVSVSELLQEYRKQIKEKILSSAFEVDGVGVKLDVTETHFGGSRYWFVCPTCSRRKGKLLRTPEGAIGCNSCLPVSYQSTRYKGMIETSV